MQAERQPQFPLLYSLQGFQYADLILAPAELAVWQVLNPKFESRNLPKALLTAALLESVQGEAGREKALAFLAEAQQVAERGPIPLYLADVHLHRARLLAMVPREQETVKAELATVRTLIEKHNYGRRLQELADAEDPALHDPFTGGFPRVFACPRIAGVLTALYPKGTEYAALGAMLLAVTRFRSLRSFMVSADTHQAAENASIARQRLEGACG
jgi:hypothetical protein